MTDAPSAADLVAMLGALTDPKKEGHVSAGPKKYSFLTLPDLLREVRAAAAAHNLALMQTVHTLDTGHTAVETCLMHTSGQEFTSGAWVMPDSPNPQAAGSQLTYWRRYQLATFVGVAGSDDDDAAQVPDYAQTRPVTRAQATPEQDPYYDPEPPPVTGGAPAMTEFSGNMVATAKQLGAIRGMAQTLGVGSVKAGEFAHWVVNQRDGNDLPDGYLLTKADASYVIEQLKVNGRDLSDQWQGPTLGGTA